MFAIEINKENYEYDIQALVKSFYPKEQIAVLLPESRPERRAELADKVRIRLLVEEEAGCGEADSIRATLTVDEKEAITLREKRTGAQGKARSKRFFYGVLSRETGKELPWGNLIGIRPTKIAYSMLEEGKTGEEIICIPTGRSMGQVRKKRSWRWKSRSGRGSFFPVSITRTDTAFTSGFLSVRQPVCTVPLLPMPSGHTGNR